MFNAPLVSRHNSAFERQLSRPLDYRSLTCPVTCGQSSWVPGWTDHIEQPIDQNAPATNLRKVPMDVICISSDEEDTNSSGVGQSSEEDSDDSVSTSSSDTSSGSEPSFDLSLLGTPNHGTKGVFQVDKAGNLIEGDNTLRLMEAIPSHWPLARLSLPLKQLVHRLDRLLASYIMELMATYVDVRLFFCSNAAWVSPGQFALQSAKPKKLPECTIGH